MNYKYKKAIIGGTFDHLHRGHKFFIDKAFKNSEFVTVGVTSDCFSKNKKFSQSIQSFKVRKKSLTEYLRGKVFLKRARIVEINDIYGTSLKDKNIDVIFVDEKGYENALKINKKRKELRFTQIKIIKNKYILDSEGKTLSSTKIREGIINRNGKVYFDKFASENSLLLPLNLRNKLRRPFGKIEKEMKVSDFRNKFVIAVGDIVVSKLYELKIIPSISIYDLKTKRQKITDKKILKFLPKENLIIKNSHGTITKNALIETKNAINRSLESQKTVNIKVIGEEDLLALPAILFSPLSSIIVYGIRGRGSVVVDISEDLKDEISKILQKFTF